MGTNCRRLLLVALCTLSSTVWAQWVVTDPGAIAESVRQSVSLGLQLEEVRKSVQLARDQLQIARDLYAGIDEFRYLASDKFLEDQRSYFMTESGLDNGMSMLTDLGERGLHGGSYNQTLPGLLQSLSSSDLLARFHEKGRERAIALRAPEPRTASEALLLGEMATEDPALARLFSFRKKQAAAAEERSLGLVQEAFCGDMPKESRKGCLSPGKAQQLSAMGASLSAVELARLNDKLGKSVTLSELDRSEKSVAAMQQKAESDALWQRLGNGIRRRFKDTLKEVPTK